MKGFLRKEISLLLTCALLVASLFIVELPVNAANSRSGAISDNSYSGCDYVVKKGKTTQISLSVPAIYASFKSDNTKIAKVSSDGAIKGVKKGITKITVSLPGYTYDVTVAVTDKNFYAPGEYRVGKEIPAGEYVLVYVPEVYDSTNSNYGYYSINKKKKLVSSDSFYNTNILKVKKGQTLTFRRCYAVPLSKASKSLFKVSTINKRLSGSFKVGKGVSAGRYKFTPKQRKKSSSKYGTVYIYTTSDRNSKKRIAFKTSKKSFKLNLQKGWYVYVNNCKMKKIG